MAVGPFLSSGNFTPHLLSCARAGWGASFARWFKKVQACVSQKTRKRLGPENRPVKLPKRLSGVSQSARKKSSLRNTSFSPVNFTGTHYLPKRVFGTVFLYLVNKMASADILFRAKQTAKALHKKRENWGGKREQCNEIRILPKRISMANSS